ncbi:preprotein translocase subunit SecA [Clostridium cavendishii DSM 21758]|uniref:Protein translocase subunit SecA n=1 Tax=Clostridium cavendishii DSM 21758 TaxID=1121302 RepID=A0A1M6JB68_9CLOT|nr:DEAD/DEAH box helicase [Clostridium cavendishii]SHJ43976.1 preprotein translocase subunit SecA [Clostridium cavendishii DSM 21758]
MIKRNTLLENYKTIVKDIKKINLTSLSNNELLNKSQGLKELASKGTDLNSLIVEGFALVKEAVKRTLGFEVFDVQLLAALALNDRKLIEMQTGEGKTLTAVFPAYLNSLLKKGVHILTFNDYLAKRDALWMKAVYEMLGVTVGFIQENMDKNEKKKAYACDITYVTAKESGFDYLRDSICYNNEDLIHRGFHFAIIDEADSILIDEARIPMVIATNTDEKDNDLKKVRKAITMLDSLVDYTTDEYSLNVYLTDKGIDHIEKLLGCKNLYSSENFSLLRQVNSALYAEVLLEKDIDYIIKNNKIQMVDEFTGRIAKNRHWPDGLQGALETKENLEVQSSGKIIGQITLQHFISLYENLAGMTGTAIDSEDEFFEYYGMEIVIIPPNKKSIRKDLPNYVFTHKEAKFNALAKEIKEVHTTGQPILIGTSSIRESSLLADKLLSMGVNCQVLNAKNDELEAKIIEKAGVLGAVTVSTNMAGRGIDILLGGPNGENREQIKELGGLYVIGTNLYESLRIDKQLKGRAGRQGDPGMTRFFVSLEDELIVKYGIQNIIPDKYIPKLQDEALENGVFNQKINQIQRIVQGKNSDLRKELYKFSIILNDQRQYMYNMRIKIITNKFNDEVLSEFFPNLYEKFNSIYTINEIEEFKKNLRLFYINKYWADYLNIVSNIKEGIHLNIINGRNPLAVFHMRLIEEFETLQQEIDAAIKEDYRKLEVSEISFEEINKRNTPPLSTWTYFVNDNSLDGFITLIPIAALLDVAKVFNLKILRDYISIFSFAMESAYYKFFKKDA